MKGDLTSSRNEHKFVVLEQKVERCQKDETRKGEAFVSAAAHRGSTQVHKSTSLKRNEKCSNSGMAE
jgi:hypothetical protein